MELKAPLSLDGQIDKLKSHGMIITDDNRVKNILSRINYFVPKRRSPASPKPGRMYPCSLRHLSRVET